ncbi:alcohol dehydrogenase transcription factor myb/SANT-like domain-containing protein [Phthorimaea operculella]|nr:alcohol dehydrogenase transcription factor myb/SANT-like domain-containing protein [Phthorimaea operculella]
MYQERREAIESQVAFIKQVKKHPCLYNNVAKYSNKGAALRAWKEIAEALNQPVHECKERWRRIRTCFVRSLRLAKTHMNRPYYLHDHLTFLIPHLKGYELAGEANASLAASDDEEVSFPRPIKKPKFETQVITADDDDDDRITDDMPENGYEDVNYLDDDASENESPSSSFRVVHQVDEEPDDTPQKDRNRKISHKEEINARKMFLLSLLPDVESLTDEEMRIFRRSVISTIDGILSSRRN